MAGPLSWLERYLAKVFFDHGTELTQRTGVDFAGTGVTVTDDPDNDQIVVTINAAATPPAPVGGDGVLQASDGAGGFEATNITDDGTTVTSALPVAIVDAAAPATPTGKVVHYAEGDVPKVVEPSGIVTQLSEVSLCLAADFTTSATTAQPTNLTFAMGANDVWIVEFEGVWNVASGAAGAKIAIAGPGTALIEGGIFAEGASLTADSTGRISALGTLSSAFNTGANVTEPVKGFFRIKGDGATAGAVTFEVASGAAVVLTLKKGFHLRARRVVEV